MENKKFNKIVAICISSNGKPFEMDKKYWVEEGKNYKVDFFVSHKIDNKPNIRIVLEDIYLPENSHIYDDSFPIENFAFEEKDINKVKDLIDFASIFDGLSLKDFLDKQDE